MVLSRYCFDPLLPLLHEQRFFLPDVYGVKAAWFAMFGDSLLSGDEW